MKKAGIVIAVVLCVALVCGGFYYVKNHLGNGRGEDELTEVQKLIARDLSQQYPTTPREVVKFYNRIILAYYEGKLSDDEFDALADQALLLFDAELAEENPKDSYMKSVQADIADFSARKRSIAKANVCDTKDVMYRNDPSNGDEIAYVLASYFIKTSSNYDKTYQQYVLRKDADGNWKILTYYQVEGKESEEEED